MTRQPRQDEAFTLVEALVVIAVLGIVVLMLMPAGIGGNKKAQAQRINCTNNLKQVGLAAREESGNLLPQSVLYVGSPPDNKPHPPNESDIMGNLPDSGYTYQYFALLTNYLDAPKLLICPADERKAHTNFSMLKDNKAAGAYLNNTKVSYFIGRDADFESRPQMLYSGDRNIGPREFGMDYGYSMPPSVGTGNYVELGTNNTSAGWTEKMHNRRGNVLFADGHVEGLSSAGFRKALSVTGDPNGTATKGNLILFP